MSAFANTLRDTVSTLNLQGYRGNDLIVALTLTGDWPMPALVNCLTSPGADALPFPATMQPGVSISGRTIQLLFTNTRAYKSTATHAISFDGRVVLAGTLSFNRQTVAVPGPVNQAVSVGLVEGDVVNVSVLIGASAGGSSLLPDLTLPVGVNGQTRWNVGGGEPRRGLFFNGVKMTRGVDYKIELPFLDWLSPVLIETNDELVLTN